MRKFAKLLLTTVCILCLAVLSVGCLEEVDDDSSSSVTHVHVAEDDWHSGGEYHWQLCAECGEEMNKGVHAFSALNVAVQPAKTAYTVGETFDKTGMKIEGECVCGNIEITDYTVAYQIENARAFAVNDDHVVISYGELSVNVSVTVGKIKLEKPVADATEFVYNGNAQTYTITENERYTVSGNTQTNAGTYTVTVALKDTANVSWADDTTDDLTYTFEIAKLAIEKPVADTTKFIYNGSAQTYTIAENERYTVSGNTQTNAGTYTVTVALKDPDNVSWTDGSTDNLSYTFEISKLDIEKPVADTTKFIYNGSAQTYNIAESERYTVSGNTQTNAGTYTVTVALKDKANVSWAGGSTDDLSYTFEIAKADNAIEWAKEGSEYASLDVTYPAVPAPQATATSGTTVTFTYANKDKTKTGAWADVYETATQYVCIAAVAESENYNAAMLERMFTVFKADNVIEWAKNGNEFISLDITYGETPAPQVAVKGGATVTYSYYKAVLTDGQFIKTDKLDAWSTTDCGAGLYCCVVNVAETGNYNSAVTERFFNVFKAQNEITFKTNDNGDILGLDFVYGNAPIENTATCKAGELIYTYTLVNRDSLGDPVEPAADAVYAPWSDANISGIYQCKIFVAETDNYYSVTTYRWVRVHKADNTIEWAKNGDEFITLDTVYGIAPDPQVTVKGGATVTFTYYKAELIDGQFTKTDEIDAWNAVDCGAGLYCCVVNVAENDYYKAAATERFFRVNKADNEITFKTNDNGDILSLDFVYGNGPIENTAISKAGAITYTYTLVNSDSWGAPVEPASDAVYSVWSDANTTGIYKCKLTVEETDNYYSVTAYRWVRVHKREADENGVKYAYYENADKSIQTYYVTGYAGSSTEVNVLEKFNDGVHGEKAVTIVKNGAFAENQQITKVILPSSITRLDGSVFQNCGKLQYVSMIGITDMAFLNLGKNGIYAGASEDVITNNNFLGCTSLKYLVVNKTFNLFKDSPDAQQFVGDAKCIDLYVLGFEAESNVRVIGGKGNNGLLSGSIYYKVDDTAEVKCGQWKFDENGEIVHGASAHNYIDGKCECGEYNTQGVVYEYDADKKVYYVGLNNSLSLSVVNILAKYNDGVHGELEVTYVRNAAFRNNTTLNKVVLDKNITRLEGEVFSGCSNLQYVSMVGVIELTLENISNNGIYVGEAYTTNNFMNCGSLTTLIVGSSFTVNGNHFIIHDAEGLSACVNVYLSDENSAGTMTVQAGTSNGLLTNSFYHYSETAVSGCWHYDESGNAVLWN